MRLFLGCPIPASPELDLVTLELAKLGARTVDASRRHITLRFLGEVADPSAVVDALPAELPAIGPFRIAGVGSFQNLRRATVAFAAVQCEGLAEIAQLIGDLTSEIGQPIPRRRFSAHITLARFNHPTDIRAWVKAHRRDEFATGDLEKVVLWQSHLTPGSPVHEPLRSWPFR